MSKTERKNQIMATNYTEKIASIEEQITQLKNRERELLQKSRSQERKARTRRLIERGAIIESLIPDTDTLTGEQFKSLIEKTLSTEQTRRALAEIKKQDSGTPAQKHAVAEQTTDEDGIDEDTDGAGETG
jgi:hypothetical protein